MFHDRVQLLMISPQNHSRIFQLPARNSYYMSCFEFVNLSVNPLHSSKYTQWNEVEARLDDFIQNFFILGAFCSQEC